MARVRVGREVLERMGKAELRAVASDRGYRIGAESSRTKLVATFLAEQDKDSELEEGAVGALPTAEEYPELDTSRSDEDLQAQFVQEALDRHYGQDAAAEIARGRLADLRAGGTGYQVRVVEGEQGAGLEPGTLPTAGTARGSLPPHPVLVGTASGPTPTAKPAIKGVTTSTLENVAPRIALDDNAPAPESKQPADGDDKVVAKPAAKPKPVAARSLTK